MFTGFFSRNIRQVFARRAALLGAALGLSFGVMVSPASAAVELLVNGDGKLTGANGVDVGGTLYDVRFVDGTCVAVFSGCDSLSDFQFIDRGLARDASTALLDQVFVDVGPRLFDSDPSLTCGAGAQACRVLTPVEFIEPVTGVFRGQGRAANNRVLEAEDGTVTTSFRFTEDFALDPTSIFALWTPSVSAPVPLPATLPLIGLGLGAAALVARRKRSSHQPATA